VREVMVWSFAPRSASWVPTVWRKRWAETVPRPSPDDTNLPKRLLTFTLLGNENPAGQPPGLAPSLMQTTRPSSTA